MKKTVKILAFVLCAVMLVVGSVFGTYAYLTSQTDTITNTFTVGNVKITMDESKVNEYGVVQGTDRVTANTYKLVPNTTYVKDPTIHVAEGSEVCYLFVKVVNGLAAIEAGTTIEQQMLANGWAKLSDYVYYYGATVDARTEAKDVEVFDEFTIRGDADVNSYKNASITITGYAVQKQGFDDAAAAWTGASFN